MHKAPQVNILDVADPYPYEQMTPIVLEIIVTCIAIFSCTASSSVYQEQDKRQTVMS